MTPSSEAQKIFSERMPTAMGSSANEKIMKLSALDHIMPRTYIIIPLSFEFSKDVIPSVLTTLQKGFSNLLQDIPVLNGYIADSAIRKGEVEARVPHRPDSSMANCKIRDFSATDESTDFQLKFVPIGGSPPLGTSAPVFAVQVNVVQTGIVICVCVYHMVMDGTAMAAVIGRWAAWCKAISSGSEPPSIQIDCLDRSPLILGGRRVEQLEHPTYFFENEVAKIQWEKALPPATERPRMIGRCFQIKTDEVTVLKHQINSLLASNDGTNTDPNQSGRWISTQDTYCALLWHAITRARLQDRNDEVSGGKSRLGIPINIRSKLNPPLPSDYLGNAAADAYAELSLDHLLSESVSDLAQTALCIRQGIAKVDDRHVRSLIAAIDGLKDASMVKGARRAYLSDDLTITSWLDFGLNQLNWGGVIGQIEEKTPSFDGYEGLCIVLPRRRDGSIQIMVGLVESIMKKFEEDEKTAMWLDAIK